MQTDLCNVIINEKKVFKILTTVFEQFGRDKSFFTPQKVGRLNFIQLDKIWKMLFMIYPTFLECGSTDKKKEHIGANAVYQSIKIPKGNVLIKTINPTTGY